MWLVPSQKIISILSPNNLSMLKIVGLLHNVLLDGIIVRAKQENIESLKEMQMTPSVPNTY